MPSRPIQILYATVSGTAEQLARETACRLKASGWAASVANVAEFPAAGLVGRKRALLVVSTWGDGQPPPDAAEFCTDLGAADAPRLETLAYAVLALGSSRYPNFCGCGRRVDEDLARRGARRLLPRVECDAKIKAKFEDWLARVEAALGPP